MQEEKVTKLERDVWVSAFGWAAAWGSKDPAFEAAVAVVKLRDPATEAPRSTATQVQDALRAAVQIYDQEIVQMTRAVISRTLPTAAEIEAEGFDAERVRARQSAAAACPGCRATLGYVHAQGCEYG